MESCADDSESMREKHKKLKIATFRSDYEYEIEYEFDS